MLHKGNNFSNAPFLASEELPIPGALFITITLAISMFFFALSFAVPDEYDVGFKVVLGHEAIFGIDILEELKLITFGIVNGDVEPFRRGVLC